MVEPKRNCLTCVFRPRDSGGNGNCPKVEVVRLEFFAASLKGEEHGCASWKLGDLRKKDKLTQEETLF